MSEIVTVIVERPINVTHISRGQAATVSTQRVVQTDVVPQPVIVQNDTTIGVINTVPSKTTVGLPGIQGTPGATGPEGPAGPPGPSGGSDFVYPVNIPTTTINIEHNLARYPNVVFIDSAGTTITLAVEYIDSNNLTITSSVPITGTAYLD